jgi:hypothetical protein
VEAIRLVGTPTTVGDVAETFESIRAREVVARLVERLLVQGSRKLVVVKPQGDLGIDQHWIAVGDRGRPRTGRKVILRDAQPLPHLSKELERRNSITGLDPGDVGRRAPGKREIPLAQPGTQSSVTEAATHLAWIVDVRGLLARHEGQLLYTPRAAPGPGSVPFPTTGKDGPAMKARFILLCASLGTIAALVGGYPWGS